MDYLPRSIETAAKDIAHSFKVLFLTGARQVGKSTLLQHTFNTYRQVTFDDPLLLAQATEEPQLFINDHPAPVLIDEIQYAPHLLPYLKMVVDNSDERGLYLLTGSQQFHLMRDVSESLAGRVGILELSPLSLREIQKVDFLPYFLPTKNYLAERRKVAVTCADPWDIIHQGGYPELQNPDVSWEQYFSSYVKTYIERDINDLTKVRDHLKFTQFLTALAARTGQMLNYQNIANELEISLNTVKNWVSLLETSGLIYLLQPFSNNALHRAIKTPKLYFRDTGLVCYLTKWTSADAARSGAMAGALFETFVISEIVKSFANVGLDYRLRLSYYRGKDKISRTCDGLRERHESEIDLIIEENGYLHPVEIKMTGGPKAEMAAAYKVLDTIPHLQRGEGAIVCLCNEPLSLREDLSAIPIHYL